MNLNLIILLSIIGLWLIVLLISGLLAGRYNLHHTPYQKERNAYQKDWTNIKRHYEANGPLSPIALKFSLPSNEKAYYYDYQNELYLYGKKSQEYKFLIKTEGQKPTIYQAYEQDFDFLPLKSSFRLGLKASPKPQFDADVYITNQRVIFSNRYEKTKVELPLSQIRKAYFALIYTSRHYSRGYVIQTDDEVYEVVSNQPEAVLIINDLLRQQIK
ncbi:hypothetical protein JN01_0590 [Entomoplasma freundtii]|uniref:Uncharacterized protein n=1 Tax=Entomoplasma freundtii TaxID=74700 RepID=A0A2K8NRC2_9MOLU|nr:hypothetical protein [Entomoplasma freundtii]ATZ16369.1 hypothetical protein EFREU_v1c03430 [Entomoplasma freundtii]TDY56592.1 hypothetical protein JN01_0590 [Entomoplasma freundtii]